MVSVVKKTRKKTEKENEKYDILQLDEKIKKMLSDESKKLSEYNSRINTIKKELLVVPLYRKRKELFDEKENIEKKIKDIENNNIFAEYICVSQNIINEYINLLSVPTNQHFFGEKKNTDEENNRIINQDKLQDKFLEIAKKYLPIKLYKQETIQKKSCVCGNNTNFTQNENNYICNECGIENIIYSSQTNYRDVDRVNLSQKYKYNRRIHFRDIIHQYQGKQNKKIDQKVYEDCENWFYEHNLLVGERINPDNHDWYKNHSKITKEYIVMSLKENKYINNYDDMNYMHNYFTGIPCPDISDIENELLDDFDSFLEVYESFSDLDRTNLLNGQYILYRFLKRRKRPVKITDFHMVSTRDRLTEYSEIYNRICFKLEWQND